jgi:RNA polymerase sigma factor (TIGR02999 family)
MRQVIVDHARVRLAAKHGAGAEHLSFTERDMAVQHQAEHVLAVHDALGRLAEENPRLMQVVECRFFAGYSEVETAAALGVSSRTVERDWVRAKAWLREAIDGSEPPHVPKPRP